MKTILSFAFTLLFCFSLAQEAKPNRVYNPTANASQDIQDAVVKAKTEGKHVLIQAGGNWCSWCVLFNKLTTTNDSVQSTIQKNYEVVHLNYSKENKNEAVFSQLEYPQRFGFPVFIILDENGKRLHTQNSSYLEEGKGYNTTKVIEFLNNWSTTALDPKSYQKN